MGHLPYPVLHASVLGLAKGALLVALVRRLFPDRLDGRAPCPAESAPPSTAAERRLGALLAATLPLWVTDPWHGPAPAWVGLAAAVARLWSGVGVLPPDAFAGLNSRILFHVSGLLGLVAAAGHLGLGAALGHALPAVLPLEAGYTARDFGPLVALSAALSLAVTGDGAPALFTALAGEVGAATGLDLDAVLMVQVLGVSAVVFAHQAPPIAVAARLGGVRPATATRLGAAFALLPLLVLAPLDSSGGACWACSERGPRSLPRGASHPP